MKAIAMRIADFILAYFQRACTHPDYLISADVLEGTVDGLEVKWCRRCGAICTYFDPIVRYLPWAPYPDHPHYNWRLPDPNLFRGK